MRATQLLNDYMIMFSSPLATTEAAPSKKELPNHTMIGSSDAEHNTGPSSMPIGRVIILNGFPGTGKSTILNRLKEHLSPDTCLVDNHLLIDPAIAVIPDRSPSHYDLRRQIRRPIFDAVGERAGAGHTILMTACLADNAADAAVLEEHLDIVAGSGVAMFWINLSCEWGALEQRVQSTQRRTGDKTKLTDPEVLRALVKQHCLVAPPESASVFVDTLDVSGDVDTSVDGLLDIVNPAWKVR
jgi:hypothetical protein